MNTIRNRLLKKYAVGPGDPPEFGFRQMGKPTGIEREASEMINMLHCALTDIAEARCKNKSLVACAALKTFDAMEPK